MHIKQGYENCSVTAPDSVSSAPFLLKHSRNCKESVFSGQTFNRRAK